MFLLFALDRGWWSMPVSFWIAGQFQAFRIGRTVALLYVLWFNLFWRRRRSMRSVRFRQSSAGSMRRVMTILSSDFLLIDVELFIFTPLLGVKTNPGVAYMKLSRIR
jgi:hypothetical protein